MTHSALLHTRTWPNVVRINFISIQLIIYQGANYEFTLPGHKTWTYTGNYYLTGSVNICAVRLLPQSGSAFPSNILLNEVHPNNMVIIISKCLAFWVSSENIKFHIGVTPETLMFVETLKWCFRHKVFILPADFRHLLYMELEYHKSRLTTTMECSPEGNL